MKPTVPLVQFKGRPWFTGEKKQLRLVLEGAESALDLEPPQGSFFEARWQASVYVEQPVSGNGALDSNLSGDDAPDATAPLRRFTAVRAGHSRVFSAATMEALCAQIQGLTSSGGLSLDP